MNAKQLLEKIMDNVADGIITIDVDNKILSANTSVCSFLSYASWEILTQPVTFVFDTVLQWKVNPDTIDDIVIQDSFANKRSITGTKKDGTKFSTQIHVEPLDHNQEIFVCFLHHMRSEVSNEATELAEKIAAEVKERTGFLKNRLQVKEAEKIEISNSLAREKEINQLKTRFVSIASHEFRSPLTSIQLSASLIESYYDRLNKRKILDNIRKIKIAVGDLTAILNDFLSIERIETGKIEPVLKPFDFAALAADIIIEMRMSAKPGQTITYRNNNRLTNPNLDRKILKHCLINLLSNAIKYSGREGVIEMKAETSDSIFKITVRDNGIGIPFDDQNHMFEPFFRAKNTDGIQGTGLGLNIVKRYIDLMHGSITFDSVENGGTVFTLKFPTNDLKSKVIAAEAI